MVSHGRDVVAWVGIAAFANMKAKSKERAVHL